MTSDKFRAAFFSKKHNLKRDPSFDASTREEMVFSHGEAGAARRLVTREQEEGSD